MTITHEPADLDADHPDRAGVALAEDSRALADCSTVDSSPRAIHRGRRARVAAAITKRRGSGAHAQRQRVVARLQQLADRAKLPESRLGRMIEQLRAAEATGDDVYLVVPDSIGDMLAELIKDLGDHRLDKVRVIR
jgi:hypothetical protein